MMLRYIHQALQLRTRQHRQRQYSRMSRMSRMLP